MSIGYGTLKKSSKGKMMLWKGRQDARAQRGKALGKESPGVRGEDALRGCAVNVKKIVMILYEDLTHQTYQRI